MIQIPFNYHSTKLVSLNIPPHIWIIGIPFPETSNYKPLNNIMGNSLWLWQYLRLNLDHQLGVNTAKPVWTCLQRYDTLLMSFPVSDRWNDTQPVFILVYH